MDPAVGKCLDGNAEVAALQKKLGPIDTGKILAYIMSHFFAVKKSICKIEDTWNKPDYTKAGSEAMVLTK